MEKREAFEHALAELGKLDYWNMCGRGNQIHWLNFIKNDLSDLIMVVEWFGDFCDELKELSEALARMKK